MGINKSSYGIDGKLRPNVREEYFRIRLERTFKIMDIEEKKKKPPIPPIPGVRTIVLEAYKKDGVEAAYIAGNIANKRIGKDIYTKKIIDKWIKEEIDNKTKFLEKQKKSKEILRDDD